MLALMFAVPALALLTLGCGGGGDKKTTGTSSDKKKTGDGDGKKAAAGGTIKPGDGKLTGRVVLDGAMPKLAMTSGLAEHPDAKQCCLKGSEQEKNDQTWIVGKDKGVANVVVYLAAPKGSKFEVVQSDGAVVVDQPHCAYVPHVVAVKPGQYLLVKNSADCSHNTKYQGDPTVNRGGGETLPPHAKEPLKIELNPQSDPIVLRCDIHKFMEAKVFVPEHQYIAVTDENGKFTIDNVPTGVELSVVMFHEGSQYFYGGKKGTAKTFKSGDNDLGEVKISAK
jgi:plastocyanin